MQETRPPILASLIVVATGVLWGFYWMPVRHLAGDGLDGAWGTLVITLSAVVVLLPFAAWHWRDLRSASPLALGAVALGGAAFALYSVGFVYGRVALIILLFFLTPVWSALIGRYVMGWPIGRLRGLAILVGIAGLTIMLGADGTVPMPRGAGEWMALLSGVMWAVATTGIRVRKEIRPAAAAFVFALGASVATGVLLLSFEGKTGGFEPEALPWAMFAGVLWWGVSMASLMWATARLDPARVGILLMSEVLVGAGSAALFAGEHLSRSEIAGGALVLCAAVLEVWPVRARS